MHALYSCLLFAVDDSYTTRCLLDSRCCINRSDCIQLMTINREMNCLKLYLEIQVLKSRRVFAEKQQSFIVNMWILLVNVIVSDHLKWFHFKKEQFSSAMTFCKYARRKSTGNPGNAAVNMSIQPHHGHVKFSWLNRNSGTFGDFCILQEGVMHLDFILSLYLNSCRHKTFKGS